MPVFSPLPHRVRAVTAAVAAVLALSGCSAPAGPAASAPPSQGPAAPSTAPAASPSASPASERPSTPASSSAPAPVSEEASAPSTPAATPAPSSRAPEHSGSASASSTASAASSGEHGATDCSVATCIALTFDDGPRPATDPALLEVLAAHGAKATFFMLGENAKAHPATVRRIAEAGHELGNHSTTHPLLTHISAAGVEAELSQTSASIRAATGRTPTVMRPPYGATNPSVRQAIADAGMRQVLWDVDTLDWKTKDAASTLAAVKAQAHRNAIVLMHDIHMPTVEAVDPILTWLEAEGYTPVTVSDLLDG